MYGLPQTEVGQYASHQQEGAETELLTRTLMHCSVTYGNSFSDARLRVAVGWSALYLSLTLLPASTCFAADSSLAVIKAGISTAEDGAFVSTATRFLPGDPLYFTFEIGGFQIRTTKGTETKSIGLSYEITPQDAQGRPLAPSASGEIQTELAAEDKNWVPKRRASFSIPSFVAAGEFHIHVSVKDLFAGAQTSADLPFSIGGVEVTPTAEVAVEQFAFLRKEDDADALSVPAYRAGDTVYARFNITGFQSKPDNSHHLAYSVLVLSPNGKPYIQETNAAHLDATSFYPAQFVPANIELNIGKDAPHGAYIVLLTVHDLVSNRQAQSKQIFTIE